MRAGPICLVSLLIWIKPVSEASVVHNAGLIVVGAMTQSCFGDVLDVYPRVELFARQKTKGWDVFGNEVEGSISLEN